MNKRSAGILSSSLALVAFGLAGVPAGVVARNNAERGEREVRRRGSVESPGDPW